MANNCQRFFYVYQGRASNIICRRRQEVRPKRKRKGKESWKFQEELLEDAMPRLKSVSRSERRGHGGMV